MPKPLPIIWYLEESELPDGAERDEKVNQIARAVEDWEKAGDRTLNDLRAEIERILRS